MENKQDFVIKAGVLTKYTGPGGDVTLPEEVTAIGRGAFWACETITSIVIPDRVKSIEEQAFGWCEHLERVALPDGLTRIENGTFGKCRSLREIHFPAKLREIGAGAFFGCESLTELDLPEGLESIEESWWGGMGGCFQECTGLTRIRIPASLTKIYGTVFRGCTRLETIEVDPANPSYAVENGLLIDKDDQILRFCPPGITGILEIPEGVVYLPRGCFEGCANLTGVTFPASLEEIDGEAFQDCTGLTSIRIPDGVKVEFRMFEGCTSLTDVILPADMEEIRTDFFKGCTALASVTLPKGLKRIDSTAFQDSGLETIRIPASVENISWSAFQGCQRLAEIRVDPNNSCYYSVNGMLVNKKANWSGPAYTLECCPPGKAGVCSIPAEITGVSSSAFDGCGLLTSFEVDPDNEYLDAVDGMLVGKCEGKGWQYPEKGTLIRFPCGRAGECAVPEGMTALQDNAFEDCAGLTRIVLPKSLEDAGRGTFHGCTSLMEIAVDPENETYVSLDGMLVYRHKEDDWSSGMLIAYPAGRAVGDIVIPEGVETLGLTVFWDCKRLTGVTLPAGLKRIDGASSPVPPFKGCTNLERLVLPEGLETIDNGAFYTSWGENEYEKLSGVVLPRSVTNFGEAHSFYVLPEGIFQEPKKKNACFADQLEEKSTQERLTPKDWAGIYLFQSTKKFKEACKESMTEPMDPYVEGMAELLLVHGSAARFTKAAEFVQDHLDQLSAEAIQKLLDAAVAKKAKKAVDLLSSLVSNCQREETAAPIDPNDPYAALREKYSEPMLLKRFQDRKGAVKDLKTVKLADGSKAPDFVTLCAIVPYAEQYERPTHIGRYKYGYIQTGEVENADKAAALLDRESLLALLETLAGKHPSWYIPYCRYADGKRITSLNSQMRDWASWYTYGAGGRSLIMTVRGALMLSDTREAMLALDKGEYKDQFMKEYARRRGTDADTLRDTILADFGLDENGKKVYDLGGNTVTVSLGPELKLSLYDENAQKTVKSIPKKGADEARHAAAKADFAELKKNIRKVVKARCDQLFLRFLSGETWNASDWKAAYAGKNPVLRQVASLLVWSQKEKSFTLRDGQPIGPEGTAYVIGQEPVCLAYPTELPAEDLENWRKYFANNGIKQPFAQVWEPAMRAEDVKEDRYEGCEVPVHRFKGQEKHGITFDYNQWSDDADLNLYFPGCTLEFDADKVLGRHELYLDNPLTLGKFSFRKYTRSVNHIVALLDKWTITGRIMKGDVSVMAQMDGATLAQVTEYLNLSIEHNQPSITAELLNYKNEHFAGFDPFAKFTLDDL